MQCSYSVTVQLGGLRGEGETTPRAADDPAAATGPSSLGSGSLGSFSLADSAATTSVSASHEQSFHLDFVEADEVDLVLVSGKE